MREREIRERDHFLEQIPCGFHSLFSLMTRELFKRSRSHCSGSCFLYAPAAAASLLLLLLLLLLCSFPVTCLRGYPQPHLPSDTTSAAATCRLLLCMTSKTWSPVTTTTHSASPNPSSSGTRRTERSPDRMSHRSLAVSYPVSRCLCVRFKTHRFVHVHRNTQSLSQNMGLLSQQL